MTVDFRTLRGGADSASGVVLPDTKVGTATFPNPAGTQLEDDAARFLDDNIARGMAVLNTTDGSTAVVTEVISQTVLTHTPLLLGSENDWDVSDAWEIIVDTHFLIPSERFCVFAASGGAGPVTYVLPNAKDLPILTSFHILFTDSSSQDVQIRDYGADGTDGNPVQVFDLNGVPRTTIDHAAADWGAAVGIEARLISNANAAGVWTIYNWSRQD